MSAPLAAFGFHRFTDPRVHASRFDSSPFAAFSGQASAPFDSRVRRLVWQRQNFFSFNGDLSEGALPTLRRHFCKHFSKVTLSQQRREKTINNKGFQPEKLTWISQDGCLLHRQEHGVLARCSTVGVGRNVWFSLRF